jgi:hypothetical protein
MVPFGFAHKAPLPKPYRALKYKTSKDLSLNPRRFHIGIFRGPPVMISLKGWSDERRLFKIQIAITY